MSDDGMIGHCIGIFAYLIFVVPVCGIVDR
jgi:hypothetical protein